MNYFAENIKYLLKLKKVTQSKAATDLGFKQSTFSMYTNGNSYPNFNDLMNIIKYFEVSATDLLETDLQNVHLNSKTEDLENAENVHLNVHPSVHLKGKKGQNIPKPEAGLNDNYIAIKEALIRRDDELIESLKAQIKLLQNQLDQMKIETHEKDQMQHTPRKDRKSA